MMTFEILSIDRAIQLQLSRGVVTSPILCPAVVLDITTTLIDFLNHIFHIHVSSWSVHLIYLDIYFM